MIEMVQRRPAKLAAFLLFILVVAACSPPPPLRSDTYLHDTSVITGSPCEVPCYQNIIVGESTFVDALNSVKANAAFKDVQNRDATTDQPAVAVWSAADGDQCCQMIANASGIVESITLRLAPDTTVGQVIEKFGEPAYTLEADYTEEEVAIAFLYPEQGLMFYVVPGDANSALEAGDPMVAAVIVDQTQFQLLLESASLKGWVGYESFTTYKAATPVITAVPTLTPTPE